MSTRSTIALEYAGNVIKKVYCHYDGYIRHVGVMLDRHYSTREQVQSLIQGGDIRGFDGDGKPARFEEDEPMFPDAYTYDSYVSSIDPLFHEYNYLFRLDGKWEVIIPVRKKGDYVTTKPKSLKRCIGALKKKTQATN